MDDGQRSRRPRSFRQAHPRRDARHSDRRQVDAPADGEQRAHAGSARGGRIRAGEVSRGMDAVVCQDLRHQGGQSGRRRGVEVGEEREPAARADRRLQEHYRGADHRAARADRRRARVAASDAPASEQPRHARQRQLDDRDDQGLAGAPRPPCTLAIPCLRQTRAEHDEFRSACRRRGSSSRTRT